MATPSVFTVVLTGIVLVFLLLLALTIIITVFGNLMKRPADTVKTVVSVMPTVQPVAKADIPAHTDDTGQLVAVITAAALAIGGGEVIGIKQSVAPRAVAVAGGWKSAAIAGYLSPL